MNKESKISKEEVRKIIEKKRNQIKLIFHVLEPEFVDDKYMTFGFKCPNPVCGEIYCFGDYILRISTGLFLAEHENMFCTSCGMANLPQPFTCNSKNEVLVKFACSDISKPYKNFDIDEIKVVQFDYFEYEKILNSIPKE